MIFFLKFCIFFGDFELLKLCTFLRLCTFFWDFENVKKVQNLKRVKISKRFKFWHHSETNLRQALSNIFFVEFEEPEEPNSRSFFSEIIGTISDVKFSHNGRYLLSRDYLTVKVWDLHMESRPIMSFQVKSSSFFKVQNVNFFVFFRFINTSRLSCVTCTKMTVYLTNLNAAGVDRIRKYCFFWTFFLTLFWTFCELFLNFFFWPFFELFFLNFLFDLFLNFLFELFFDLFWIF